MTTGNSKNTARPEELFLQIVELLKSPPFSVASGFRALTQQKPYRELVDLGPAAISFCMNRLREGAVFLVPAVLEIWQISPDDIGLAKYASDNEVAARLVLEWDMMNAIQWFASAAYPQIHPTVQLAATEPSAMLIGLLRLGRPMPTATRSAEL